ncbi:MAG: DUF4400 domain-containing protein [Cellvibrio sp.]|nr:DUF4400 domain-containing protein [Cellvibrio sp.]
MNYQESLANNITGKASLVAYYGLESLLNTLFIFTVRLSICVSAVTGFALVGLVAFIDGLVERDIRRACGAMESAFVYHRAKRAVVPLIYLSFGGYLTALSQCIPQWCFTNHGAIRLIHFHGRQTI